MNRMLENVLRCFCTCQLPIWGELQSAAECADNSSVVEGTGSSPFELDLGWHPISAVDVRCSKESNNDSVETLRSKLSSAAHNANCARKVAQARYFSYNWGRYSPPPYRPGDFVWLYRKYFADAISANQPSRKLSVRRFGPFKIIYLVGHKAARLDLSMNVRAQAVVHVEQTARVI